MTAQQSINAALLSLFDVIRQFDDPELLLANSVTDVASWLEFDLGFDPKNARSWVRIASALPTLPETSRAFSDGRISSDELRILCRYATADNESDLLAIAAETGVADLARAIRDFLDTPQPVRKNDRDHGWLRTQWSDDESVLAVRGEIPGVDGLLVETALMRLAAQVPVDEHTGLYRDHDVRQAEALVQLASHATAADADHDRATLVVHFDVAGGRTSGHIGERLIDRAELLRIACDSRLQPAIDDPTGVTVGVGRTTRKIPAWLRRLVDARDGGCRFPGCGRTRWTHAHHIVHWANGGPTNLDNLVTLCGFHHRLIHRKNWLIVGNPAGTLRFIDQWGTVYQPVRKRFPASRTQTLLDYVETYREGLAGRLAAAGGVT